MSLSLPNGPTLSQRMEEGRQCFLEAAIEFLSRLRERNSMRVSLS